MAYLSLALKYRPQTFDDVVGQEHVSVFLRKMALSRTLPPSLVFAGPRATGKTTTARIAAAAMNCSALDPTGNPCTSCIECREIRRGVSLDVLEVDAASNTGIDNIRNIKESLGYGSQASWRVVLLDEAHNLSANAFNALLKVLEEPPPNVSFVLLTTESSRILDTILSRSMYFEFQRHTAEQVFLRLSHVNQREQFAISDSLLAELVRAGRGGLRDSLMMMDQIMVVGITTVEQFRDVYGRPDFSIDLVEAVASKSVAAALDIVDRYFKRTGEVAVLAQQVALVLRDVIVVKVGGTVTGFDTDVSRIAKAAAMLTGSQAKDLVRVMWEAYARLGRGRDRAVMDMAVVQMAEVVGVPWEQREAVQPPEPEKKFMTLDDVVGQLGF